MMQQGKNLNKLGNYALTKFAALTVGQCLIISEEASGNRKIIVIDSKLRFFSRETIDSLFTYDRGTIFRSVLPNQIIVDNTLVEK